MFYCFIFANCIILLAYFQYCSANLGMMLCEFFLGIVGNNPLFSQFEVGVSKTGNLVLLFAFCFISLRCYQYSTSWFATCSSLFIFLSYIAFTLSSICMRLLAILSSNFCLIWFKVVYEYSLRCRTYSLLFYLNFC